MAPFLSWVCTLLTFFGKNLNVNKIQIVISISSYEQKTEKGTLIVKKLLSTWIPYDPF